MSKGNIRDWLFSIRLWLFSQTPHHTHLCSSLPYMDFASSWFQFAISSFKIFEKF